MYPILFSIRPFTLFGRNLGPFTLHSYGVILALAFLVGLWVVHRQARRARLDAARITDLAIYSLIAGLLGAKLMLLVVDWRAYTAQLRELLSLIQSAGIFYGGLFAALPVVWWYVRKHKLALWPTLDVIAPGLVLGQALGRWACLAAGCCFGRECSRPWAIVFRDAAARDVGVKLDTPLHPTQIYESLADLAIFFALVWLAPRKRFHGQLAAVYLLAYAAARFGVEYFRGDYVRGFVINGILSTSQAIALLVILVVAFLLPYLIKKQRIAA